MIKLSYLDNHIEKALTSEYEKDRENHTPSGKLSASRLGWPLQWQILKTIGVPQEPLGEYVIRKFRRGNHVEDWLIDYMPGIVNKQKFVEYRDVVGYVDALVDMRDWNLEMDTIPHEIKSTSNAAFKWILRDGHKHPHALQGALYALALGADNFAIDYVATDDYRVETFLLETAEFKDEIDKIIDTFNKQIKSKAVPKFEPVEKWQAKPEYNNYQEFADATPAQIEKVIEKKYPQAYVKLKGGE